jgi:Putative transposase
MLRAALLEGLASGAVTLPPSSAPDVLDQPRTALYRTDWVVYAKAPFGGAEQVYAYLGRYTHRVGISNTRLRAMDERGVTFATEGGGQCTLSGVAFLRARAACAAATHSLHGGSRVTHPEPSRGCADRSRSLVARPTAPWRVQPWIDGQPSSHIDDGRPPGGSAAAFNRALAKRPTPGCRRSPDRGGASPNRDLFH